MITIHKYQLPTRRHIPVRIPQGAKLLDCQLQRNVVCVWAVVDTEQPMEDVMFVCYGTGEPLEERYTHSAEHWTIQVHQYVWHVFRVYEVEVKR